MTRSKFEYPNRLGRFDFVIVSRLETINVKALPLGDGRLLFLRLIF